MSLAISTGSPPIENAMPPSDKPYPAPPFAAQAQPWPGLACRMEPPPDHGETRYVGHGRLARRKALITGGDSGIGRAVAVAIAFAREGADVAINYLPQEEEDARAVVALVEQAGRRAIALPGDLRDAAFCRRLVNAVAPGPYWTPLQPSVGQPTAKLATFGEDTPLGRPGQPAEIAPLYVLLASNETGFTSGNVWGSTGGETGP